jgi:hypothetical protein
MNMSEQYREAAKAKEEASLRVLELQHINNVKLENIKHQNLLTEFEAMQKAGIKNYSR